jgi:transposase
MFSKDGSANFHLREDIPMTSITFVNLMTIIYTLTDDWYKAHGVRLLTGKPGCKPEFTDSEVLSLLLVMDYLPFPGEGQFLAFLRANYLPLFPKLISQSQFNRRARALRLLLEALRRYWVVKLGATRETHFLLDTKPVPVVGYKRSKAHSQFAGSADYGVCPSRRLHYFGYKLVTLTTLAGLPVVYDLVPANADERDAAEAVVDCLAHAHIWADKGFLGEHWQANIREQTGNRVWTAKRVNQQDQNPKTFDALLNRIRERIESAFNEIQNTGRNIERLLTKTVVGLCTRVIAKMASHALKYLLRRDFGIDVQTFTEVGA